MERRQFIFASIIFGAGMGAAKAAPLALPNADSLAVVQRFFDAYSSRLLEACLSCFSQGNDVFAYGSARQERRIGLAAIRDQLEYDWAQSQETTLQLGWHKVDSAEDISWVAADVVGSTKVSDRDIAIEARATFVLRKEGPQWKIVQMHFSIPSD